MPRKSVSFNAHLQISPASGNDLPIAHLVAPRECEAALRALDVCYVTVTIKSAEGRKPKAKPSAQPGVEDR
jgi:hypothetical protein